MIKSLLFLLLQFCGQILCYSQNVLSFDGEDITFEIQDSIFTVHGIYYFSSVLEKQYSILYPFPTDSIYGKPSNISVTYTNTGEAIGYKVKKDSSSIVFSALIKEKTPVMIFYQQRLKSNKAKYILLSTKYWNKPLQQVNYKLITKPDFTINGFSIPPDKEVKLDNKKIYLWQKVNFLPTKDFEIDY
jgi:hypothetical protein